MGEVAINLTWEGFLKAVLMNLSLTVNTTPSNDPIWLFQGSIADPNAEHEYHRFEGSLAC